VTDLVNIASHFISLYEDHTLHKQNPNIPYPQQVTEDGEESQEVQHQQP
jgi:hypothetical protein